MKEKVLHPQTPQSLSHPYGGPHPAVTGPGGVTEHIPSP